MQAGHDGSLAGPSAEYSRWKHRETPRYITDIKGRRQDGVHTLGRERKPSVDTHHHMGNTEYIAESGKPVGPGRVLADSASIMGLVR